MPARSDRLRLGAGVLLVAEDGVARLLDFERGRFYALDPTGSALLALALRFGLDAAARRAAARFGVPPARVRADMETLQRDLSRRRLLARPRRPAPLLAVLGALAARLPAARPQAPPSAATIACHLLLAWAGLRLLGWRRTLELWRRRHRAAATPADPAPLAALDRRLRAVAARLPLPIECKERALALHQILRARCGLRATLVVGIQRHPFAAHAWVECAGQVLSDDAARCAAFAPVVRHD